MKKIIVLAAATFLVTGMAFAQDGDSKKCSKAKSCCKKTEKEVKEVKSTKSVVKVSKA